MTAHLALGSLTTELVTVLAAQTGLAVGDGVSPVSGTPVTADYPYLVVYEIDDREEFEMLGAASTARVEYQVTCVGLTRLQAARARDFAKVLLDPAVVVATADASMLGRVTTLSTMDVAEGGGLWSAVWRFEAVVTAL